MRFRFLSIKFNVEKDYIEILYGTESIKLGCTEDSVDFSWDDVVAPGSFLINKLDNTATSEYPNNLRVADQYQSSEFKVLDYVVLTKKNDVLKANCSFAVALKQWESPYQAATILSLLCARLLEIDFEKCKVLEPNEE
jgi:hypothetical protein